MNIKDLTLMQNSFVLQDFMIDEEQPRLAGDSHHEIHEPLQDTMQTVSEKVQSTLSSQPECGEPLLKKRKVIITHLVMV